MASPPHDTAPDAHTAQIAAAQRLSGPERVARLVQMVAEVEIIAAAGIRERHPSYSEDEVTHALRVLRLGPQLVLAAWPDRPLVWP